MRPQGGERGRLKGGERGRSIGGERGRPKGGERGRPKGGEREAKGRGEREAKGRGEKEAEGRGEREVKGREEREAKGREEREAKGRGEREAKGRGEGGQREGREGGQREGREGGQREGEREAKGYKVRRTQQGGRWCGEGKGTGREERKRTVETLLPVTKSTLHSSSTLIQATFHSGYTSVPLMPHMHTCTSTPPTFRIVSFWSSVCLSLPEWWTSNLLRAFSKVEWQEATWQRGEEGAFTWQPVGPMN